MFCFRVITLFLLFSLTIGSFTPYDLADADQYFADFIKEYEKKYENDEEFNLRFEIFKNNLKKLNEWNDHHKHENGGYVITRFTDRDGSRPSIDFTKMANTRKIQVKEEHIANAPDKIDYRDQGLVTPVKDQKHCQCCFVFAAIGNIEGMHLKHTGQSVSLSEQQVLDCTPASCDSGGVPANAMNDLANQGCMAEDDYSYQGKDGTCNFDPSKVKVRVTGGHTIDTPDVETLKGALVQNGAPLAVLFYANYSIEHYVGSDVLSPTDCPNDGSLNHAVVLVGYNADPASGKRPHWIFKNSWGTDHGDNGYFYLDFENTCSFGARATASATVAVD